MVNRLISCIRRSISVRKTKVVATLGPASWNRDVIKRMLAEGVNGFRFNFSHADYTVFSRVARTIRELDGEGVHPIIGDLQGPVVRLGVFEPFPVKRGDKVYFVRAERSSGEKEIPIPDEAVFDALREGDEVLVESGRLAFRVVRREDGRAVAEALIDGVVKPRKTLAIRGKDLPLSPLTEKDVKDIEFAVGEKFDAIALSFVRHVEDIQRLREILYDLGAEETRIIAKIETRSAVENLDAILREADIVLVARGDLAIYYRLEEILGVQRRIVEAARRRGRPSIIATQLLESMIENPVPTRSEVVDVITAVEMGADALMLAGETAAGKYPIEAVMWLNRIIREAERGLDDYLDVEPENLYEKIAKGVVLLSNIVGGKIVAFSERGNTARRLSKFRPRSGAYVFTSNPRTARYMSLLHGIQPLIVEGVDRSSPDFFEKLLAVAVERGIAGIGDLVVFTAGRRRGATDVIRVEKVKPRV